MKWHVDECTLSVVVGLPSPGCSVRLTEDQLKAMVKAINDAKGERLRGLPGVCRQCGVGGGKHRMTCPHSAQG